MAPAFIHGRSSSARAGALPLFTRGLASDAGTGFDGGLAVGLRVVRTGAGLGSSFAGGLGLDDAETVRRGGALAGTFGCETLRTRWRSPASASASAGARFVRTARGAALVEAEAVAVLVADMGG